MAYKPTDHKRKPHLVGKPAGKGSHYATFEEAERRPFVVEGVTKLPNDEQE